MYIHMLSTFCRICRNNKQIRMKKKIEFQYIQYICDVCKNCTTKLILWIHINSHKKLLDYLYFLMNSIFELENLSFMFMNYIHLILSSAHSIFWQTSLMKNCNFREMIFDMTIMWGHSFFCLLLMSLVVAGQFWNNFIVQ